MATATVASQEARENRPAVRAAYALILAVLALCAFVDSFVALVELGRATGALPGWRAMTLPIMLDGLTLAGTLFAVTRFGPRQGSPAYGYALIAVGSLASLAGNVAHAPDALVPRIIAGAPPLILFLVFEAAAMSFRRRPTASPAPVSADVEEPGAAVAPISADEPTPSAEADASSTSNGADEPAASAASDDGITGAATPTKRERARRAYEELTAAGTPVNGARLAEAAGLSPSYARSLLATFEPSERSEPTVTPANTPDTAATDEPIGREDAERVSVR